MTIIPGCYFRLFGNRIFPPNVIVPWIVRRGSIEEPSVCSIVPDSGHFLYILNTVVLYTSNDTGRQKRSYSIGKSLLAVVGHTRW